MVEPMETRYRPLKSSSPWMDAWRQVRRNRFAIVGMVILTLLILVAISAPWIAPYDPYDYDMAAGIQPPTAEHVLGTDELG